MPWKEDVPRPAIFIDGNKPIASDDYRQSLPDVEVTLHPTEVLLLRLMNGHTQDKAAELINIAVRTWRNWEIAKHPMKSYSVYKYCHATDLPFPPFRDPDGAPLSPIDYINTLTKKRKAMLDESMFQILKY